MVGPSRGAVDQVGHWACERALAGVHRYTFRDLAYALSESALYARELRPLHSVARDTLAATVARNAKLGYLRRASSFPGFARTLGGTLQDLRLNEVSSAQVRLAGRSGPDLAMLLDRWNRELATRGFADYADRIRLAVQAGSGEPDNRALLLLDVDVRTKLERELLDVLERRSATTLRLTLDRRGSAASNGLTSVQRYAMSGDSAPSRAGDSSAEFFSASSEALEFVEIARRVLKAGLPFDDMAVLLRHPGRHAPLVEEAFRRAGIPIWLQGGLKRHDNSGRAFLTLLRCREEGFSAARFSEYLSLARLPNRGREPITPAFWETLLDEAAVIAGRERWHSRLEALLALTTSEYERAPSEQLCYRMAALESLREVALPIIDELAELPAEALWGDWVAPLQKLAETALEERRTIEEALDEFAPVADLGPVSLPEVVLVLEHLISEWRPESEGARYGKVFVGSIEDARGMSFRRVFLAGLNEGLFPRRPREDPLLLDEQREALDLPASSDDGALLDIALCAAAESAVFSWARLDLATGRERVPSFFAAELIAAARGADTDLKAILDEAKASVTSKIGWSAPDDISDCIDESEYDLSSFRESLRGGHSMVWLREVNSHTVRAIDSRRRRWSAPWTDSDGLHGDYDMQVAVALKRWELTQRAYSPTTLNQFARCPYRFYLSAIAGLRPKVRPEVFDRLDPITRGHLYHRTLFRFFRREGKATLDEVLAELSREAAEKLGPPIRGVWRAEMEKLRADLHAWISGRGSEWQPEFIELAFGLPEREECDPKSVPEPVLIEGRWPMRGSIDLVEQRPDGRLRVLDHKSGKPGKKDWKLCVGHGETLQPVLYALALEALGYACPETAALSWGTLRGGFRIDPIPIDADARQKTARVLQAIDAHVHRGFLPAAPRDGACKNCDYLPVCGPWEEVRMKAKDAAELKQLREIRELP